MKYWIDVDKIAACVYIVKSLKNFYKINSLNDIMILILLFFILTSFFYLRHMLKTATKGAYIKIKEIKDEFFFSKARAKEVIFVDEIWSPFFKHKVLFATSKVLTSFPVPLRSSLLY